MTAELAATGFVCQPCFRRRCDQDTFCLATLSAETVLQAVHQLLTRQNKELES